MNWTTLRRCNGCGNVNTRNTHTCPGCGKSSGQAGYETVYKCSTCGTIVDSSTSHCPRCTANPDHAQARGAPRPDHRVDFVGIAAWEAIKTEFKA